MYECAFMTDIILALLLHRHFLLLYMLFIFSTVAVAEIASTTSRRESFTETRFAGLFFGTQNR